MRRSFNYAVAAFRMTKEGGIGVTSCGEKIRSRSVCDDRILSSFRGTRGIAAYNRDVPCVYLRFIMRAGRGARALARDIALKTGENEPDGRGCINE